MIKIVGTVFIAVYILTIGFMKQQTKNAVVKAREEERIVCENLIANTNLENQQKTTKTIIKYEKVKSNIANYDVSQRSKLLQQIEDFNFAD
jgi:hypothetical protein